MTELRKDPITGRWVIINVHKDCVHKDNVHKEDVHSEHGQNGIVQNNNHLLDLKPVGVDDDRENCPFCEGHEEHTSAEICSLREEGTVPNSPGWFVRCIPNINPVLTTSHDLGRRGLGLFDMMNSVGAHEVVIESPHHDQDFHNYDLLQVQRILRAYRERIVELKKNQHLKYVLVFKNRGKRAGSLHISHPHSQVIATPVVPIRLKMELNGTRKYYQMKERCIFCDVIRQELKDDIRVVDQNESFLCLIPFASRFPYECVILPKRHQAQYSQMEEKEFENLAQVFKNTFVRLHHVLNNPAYNCVLHDAPNTVPKKGYWKTIKHDYHWHFEIIPRTMRTAGFEWGTGFHINPVAPEKAAEDLKSVNIES
jgi:UDPglucose--hexose-1-phosphate uridylyltransferase